MIRRAPLALLALVVPALAGCATFTNVDRVATVNGADITRDEFAAMAADFYAYPDLFGAAEPENGRGDGDSARSLVSIAAQAELLAGVVGADAIDANRQAVLGALTEGDPVAEMSSEMQGLYADVTGRAALLAEVAAPDAADLEAAYTEQPASIGVMCLRHILVATEAEADAVAAELAGGADFAALAAERSLDTATAADGGVLAGTGGPCWTLGESLQAEAAGALYAGVTNQAMVLAPEAPSAPFESDFGWHVVVQRPWSEVADAVVAVHGPGVTGDIQYVGALLTADVDVDPTFGVWDQGGAEVVPLG